MVSQPPLQFRIWSHWQLKMAASMKANILYSHVEIKASCLLGLHSKASLGGMSKSRWRCGKTLAHHVGDPGSIPSGC